MFATFFTNSTPPTVPLLIFTVLSTPPNYLWQQYLERVFPGYTTQKLEVDDGGKSVNLGKRLNKRNTLKKFVLDQTLGSVVNVVAFLGGVRLLRGVSLEESLQAVHEVSFLPSGLELLRRKSYDTMKHEADRWWVSPSKLGRS